MENDDSGSGAGRALSHCRTLAPAMGGGKDGETEKKKKKSGGGKEKERNYGEGETAVFYGDQASLGQLYRIYWTVPHYSCTG